MSNTPQQSRNSGDSRRRRSRGGNPNKRHHDKRHNDHRGHHDSNPKNNQPEEFRPRGPRGPRNSAPVKLTWFQKLLKLVGLYKPKTKSRTDSVKPQHQDSQSSPKSNTRNSRSGDPVATSAQPQRAKSEKSDERPQKKERSRNKDRSRGGDGSTVESPRVYVGNLSYEVSEQDLQELFKGVGPVRSVEIVYNRTTHRSKGYGFIEMHHKDDAIRAVEVLNDQFFMGRKMMVSGAKSKGQDDRDDAETQPQKPVALAPLPAAASHEEPTIQTIVETVTPLDAPAPSSTPSMEIQTIMETPVAPTPTPETPAAPVAAETPVAPAPETPVAPVAEAPVAPAAEASTEVKPS